MPHLLGSGVHGGLNSRFKLKALRYHGRYVPSNLVGRTRLPRRKTCVCGATGVACASCPPK
eukprot:3500420-Prymnesium_polylepis.1